ncbi:hypothetical protein H0H93_003299 [Arthromyces matolae]|nr:hypothetical protein H0H93_003299 [Arthromyces matolae]
MTLVYQDPEDKGPSMNLLFLVLVLERLCLRPERPLTVSRPLPIRTTFPVSLAGKAKRLRAVWLARISTSLFPVRPKPTESLHSWIVYYWNRGFSEKEIVDHVMDHFDKSNVTSLRRLREALNLKGARQEAADFDKIAPIVTAVRKRFPTMGARQMVNVFRQDYQMKVTEKLLLEYFRTTEPEAVQRRKNHRFRRKRFWAAGVMDMLCVDQHDKWKRFGLWLHIGLDPYPGRIAWLKIWWCNRNNRLITSYYIQAGREMKGVPLITQSDRGRENNGMANCHTVLRHKLDPSLEGTLQHRWTVEKQNIKPEAAWSQLRRQFTPGFENILDEGLNDGFYDPSDPLESLVFRWLAIPWLQAELDAWVRRFNSTTRRADKHKILPVGVPDVITAKPERFKSKNFMVLVSPELFDEIEQEWAPPNDPVFQLVPTAFNTRASMLYSALGQPNVSSDTFWDVYKALLAAFREQPHDAQIESALLEANRGEEDEVPLLPGLRDLRPGDSVIGSHGFYYYGGLENPPQMNEDESVEGDDEDFREFADFSD